MQERSKEQDDLFNFQDLINISNSDNTNTNTQTQTQQQESSEFNQNNVNLGQGTGELLQENSNDDNTTTAEPTPQDQDPDKPENVSIAHITNYSFKRANYIAKMAREELIFIAFFKNPPKPIPGQKPNLKNMFEYKKFYYYPVLTQDAEEILNIKNEVARLNEISNQKNGYTDVQGNFHPPTLRENNREITSLEDKEFYNISSVIFQKQQQLNKKVLEKAFGIDNFDTYLKNSDSNSVKTAVDAAIYRIENGVVPESKNSVYS